MDKKWQHKSVLFEEALTSLNIQKGEVYVDATLGAGGHAAGIIAKGGKVIGFEVDPVSAALLEKESIKELTIVNKNFTLMAEALRSKGIQQVSGVLFDLGISSDQLSDPAKGLSFQLHGPLDMRLDPNLGVSAADLINALPERKLYELFYEYGEEHFARSIARAIVNARREKKFETTSQLAGLIEKVVGSKRGKVHPATKVFMALRIAVNNELENLEEGLKQAVEVLKTDGRLVVISFHSLEDRIVKTFFRECVSVKVFTKEPILPSEKEVRVNPRARSAKLRVAAKI